MFIFYLCVNMCVYVQARMCVRVLTYAGASTEAKRGPVPSPLCCMRIPLSYGPSLKLERG